MPAIRQRPTGDDPAEDPFWKVVDDAELKILKLYELIERYRHLKPLLRRKGWNKMPDQCPGRGWCWAASRCTRLEKIFDNARAAYRELPMNETTMFDPYKVLSGINKLIDRLESRDHLRKPFVKYVEQAESLLKISAFSDDCSKWDLSQRMKILRRIPGVLYPNETASLPFTVDV